MAALTQPGGRVVIWVPGYQQLYGEFDRAVGHVRRYTPATLRDGVRAGRPRAAGGQAGQPARRHRLVAHRASRRRRQAEARGWCGSTTGSWCRRRGSWSAGSRRRSASRCSGVAVRPGLTATAAATARPRPRGHQHHERQLVAPHELGRHSRRGHQADAGGSDQEDQRPRLGGTWPLVAPRPARATQADERQQRQQEEQRAPGVDGPAVPRQPAGQRLPAPPAGRRRGRRRRPGCERSCSRST